MSKKNSISEVKLCKHDCCNPPAPGRLECYKCRSAGIRKRKPVDVVYYWLKKSAKKRRKEFTITLPWFREWISTTSYMEERGPLTHQLTIDRKDNSIGYTPDNLQVLTKTENCKKYHEVDVVNELGKQHEGDLPFLYDKK